MGAPRATSTVPAQSGINETGAIYKCSLSSSTCEAYVFDSQGNVNSENDLTYENQQKDHQWLGASIDGNTEDGNPLVVSISLSRMYDLVDNVCFTCAGLCTAYDKPH